MANFKNPPVFNSKKKPYERYVQELTAWCEVTDLANEKQGLAVALALPEDDISGIRDNVFDSMTTEELKANDGVEKLIEFMDKLFKKDELTMVYEKYIAFDRFVREGDIIMDAFLNEFEKLYNVARRNNM